MQYSDLTESQTDTAINRSLMHQHLKNSIVLGKDQLCFISELKDLFVEIDEQDESTHSEIVCSWISEWIQRLTR